MQSSRLAAVPQIETAYKVCINDRYGSLTSANARLQVSVGNPRYEGEKLSALVEFCRRRYEHTTIILSDTLQRHNKPDPARFWMACRREGQEWFERNKASLSGLNVRRWDDCLMDHRYADARQLIDERTQTGDVHEELLRLAYKHAANVPITQCLEFLREELAVFSFMMEEKAVDIYAGSWITSAIKRLDIRAFDTVRFLSVDLQRKRQPSFANWTSSMETVSNVAL